MTTKLKKIEKVINESIISKPTRNYRISIFQLYLIIAIVVSIGLAILAHIFSYFPVDLTITKIFQQFQSPGFLTLMKFISFWGYEPQMAILSALVILIIYFLGLRLETMFAVINIIGATIITGVLKIVINRPRPNLDLVNVVSNLSDKSFPSGHVLMYTAFFGYVWFLVYILIKPSFLRTLSLFLLGSLILLVGPSRVYLGEHWPSDVFGGYLIGSVWLLLTIYIYTLNKRYAS